MHDIIDSESEGIKMKIVFIIIILIWCFLGFLGILQNTRNNSRINFEMIFFCLIIPFIPLIAKWCGLL